MADSLIVQPTQAETDALRGFRVGKWHEYDNYECLLCQYSTLWKHKMDKHLAEDTHPWAHPGQNPPGLGATGDEPDYE